MSDDTGTNDQAPATDDQDPGDRSSWTAEQWQAEADKWKTMSRKNEAASRKNAAAAEKLEKLEADKLTETQKLEQRAKAAEERAAKLELNELRATVAKTKELPAYLASRLQGSTKEELEADADALAKELKIGKRTPDLKQGNQGGKPEKDARSTMNDFIHRR